MAKKFSFVLIFVLVVSLGLSACERAASPNVLPTPTVGEETTGTEGETPETDEMMAQLQMFATQTALAAGGGAQPSATPSAAVETQTVQLPTPTSNIGVQPTATPGVIVPTAVVTRPATYTLMQGEYPFCIARRFNVDQYELLSINGLSLTQGSDLPVGYALKLPQTGNPFIGDRVLHSHPTTYVVQGNETVYKVACYFGDIAPETIIAANALVVPYTLTIGQQLNIP